MTFSQIWFIDNVMLQNFIYKHIVDLENVQRSKKKKGKIYKMLS
jgi:hypothetical protein